MSKKAIIVIVVSIILISSLVAVTILPVLTKHNLVPIPTSETIQVQTGTYTVPEQTGIDVRIEDNTDITVIANSTSPYRCRVDNTNFSRDHMDMDWYFLFDFNPTTQWHCKAYNSSNNLLMEMYNMTGDYKWMPTAGQKVGMTILFSNYQFEFWTNESGTFWIGQVFEFPIIEDMVYPIIENVTYTNWLILYI